MLEWGAISFPNPGIELRSPASQVDSLPAEPQGKPKNTGEGNLSLLQWIFPTQGSKPGLPRCRQILYQLSHKRSPIYIITPVVICRDMCCRYSNPLLVVPGRAEGRMLGRGGVAVHRGLYFFFSGNVQQAKYPEGPRAFAKLTVHRSTVESVFQGSALI